LYRQEPSSAQTLALFRDPAQAHAQYLSVSDLKHSNELEFVDVPYLRHLRLKNCCMPAVVCLPDVRVLELHDCPGVAASELLGTFSSWPGLEELQVSDCSALAVDMLLRLQCPGLKELAVESCDAFVVSTDSLTRLCSGFAHLETVRVCASYGRNSCFPDTHLDVRACGLGLLELKRTRDASEPRLEVLVPSSCVLRIHEFIRFGKG
jgi:hypothetical protein